MLELYNLQNEHILTLRSSLDLNNYIEGECKNITLLRDASGIKELSFILPLYTTINGVEEENFRWEYIQGELLVKYTDDENNDDWFKIKSYDDEHNDNGILTSNIQCKHISYDLNKKGTDFVIDEVDNATNLLRKVLSGTGWSVGTIDTSLNGKIRRLKIDTQTNTLDHLQQIIKLFDCMVVFNGNKTIDLLTTIGDDTGEVQFRYRKNLKNIRRKVNSDIITRLYVIGGDTSTGVTTISDVNPNKQPFIQNFSYYIDNDLMPIAIQNKITQYDTDILAINNNITNTNTLLNVEINAKNSKEAHLSYKQTRIQSLTQLIDELNKKLPLYTVDSTEYTNIQADITKYTNKKNQLTNGGIFTITGTVSVEADKATVIGTTTNFITDEISQYDLVTIGGIQKTVQFITDATHLTVDSNYTTPLSGQTMSVTIIGLTQLQSEVNTHNTNITNYTNTLNTYYTQKENIENQFKIDLEDYLFCGLLTKTDYVDPQALYDDAVSTLNKICIPQVTYEMSIVDLSKLTGYELEKIHLGDRIFIYDSLLKLNTDAKITKIIEVLDNPTETQIEIANYSTPFEDLFQNISRSTEVLSQKREYWTRAEKALTSDGTISKQSLQEAFNQNLIQIASGTKNSVIQDTNGITITDLNNPKNMLRLNAGILSLSSDGGNSWKVGINANGINASLITTGRLNTGEVAIYGNDNHFFWNDRGFYAINPNDSNQWIRFNKDGIVSTLDNANTYEFSLTHAGLQIGKHSVAGLETELSNMQTNINTAQSTASSAQQAAENAQTDATNAINKLNDIASDAKFTPVEKQAKKLEWDVIVSEKSNIEAQADTYGITTEKTNYTNAYTTLNTYITPILNNLTTTSDIVSATFISKWKDYYDKKTILLKTISEKAKQLADNAQGTANSANSVASTAQSTANTANSTASTAQSTANSALGTANTANSTATNAQNTANTALNTANNSVQKETLYNNCKITSANGFQVLDGSGNERLRMGAYDGEYGFKATHTDGTETMLTASGLKKKVINSGNTYNVLFLTSAGSGNTEGNDHLSYTNVSETDLDNLNVGVIWVTISNPDFAGRNFVVIPSISGFKMNGEAPEFKVWTSVAEYDYANRRVKIRARVRYLESDGTQYYYRWVGASFAYYAYATS